MGQEIYRPADLARKFNCKPPTIRAWELRGVLPPARRNGARFTFWLKQDIDDWLVKTGSNKGEVK